MKDDRKGCGFNGFIFILFVFALCISLMRSCFNGVLESIEESKKRESNNNYKYVEPSRPEKANRGFDAGNNLPNSYSNTQEELSKKPIFQNNPSESKKEERVSCYRCDGTGKLDDVYWFTPETFGEYTMVCHYCNRKDKHNHKIVVKCHVCGGKGYLPSIP